MFVKDIHGSKMCLLEDDVGLSSQLREHGTREEASTEYIKSIIKTDWITIDIGANLGYYALLEAKLGGFVYAIEPIKRSCETLKKSIKLNGYKNIKVYHRAIGSQNETQNITVSHRNNWSTMVDFNLTSDKYRNQFEKFHKGIEKVKTLTLDNFVKINEINRIDFIRMDVEGYEVEIIKKAGYAFSLMPKDSYLTIEFHSSVYKNREPILETVDRILKAGFKIVKGTWKEREFDLSEEALRHKLLNKGACFQTFFKKD